MTAIAHRLQPRDLTLAVLLDEHQLLTTEQITAILFSSPVTAVHRLRVLRRIGFIDRFIQHQTGTRGPGTRQRGTQQTGGTTTTCWIPGALSARYAALADGRPPPTAKALRDAQDRLLANPQRNHLLGANQFHIDLIAHSRAHPDTRLARWWSARRTTAGFAGKIQPDGHGIWTTTNHPSRLDRTGPDQRRQDRRGQDQRGHRQTGFWLEHDRSTEPLGKLAGKLTAYRRLRAEGGPGYPVLFWLDSRRRETNLHYRLADHDTHGVIVATAARDSLEGHSPAGPVWRLFGNGRHRLTLADLPNHPGTSGSLNPDLWPEHDPLYGLHDLDGERG